MSKIIPLYDRVVIKRNHPEEKTAGGVILPQGQEKPVIGEVVAVGPGTRDQNGQVHPLQVKVGDHVLFGKWSGTEYKDEKMQELVVVKESDILAIIQK